MTDVFMLSPPTKEFQLGLSLRPDPGRNFVHSWLYRPDQPMTSDELAKFNRNVEFDDPISKTQRLDFVGQATNLVVSNRVVELLEELDPGRHQFVELSIQNPPKELRRRPSLRLFLLNCHLYLDCIDKEASQLFNQFWENPQLRPSWCPAFNHDMQALPGWRPTAHLWRDKQWMRTTHFVSDEFRQRLEAINAGPVSYKPVHLVV